MTKTIDYYFYSASPFTYFGHQRIVDVAQRHGATLNIKPVNLMALWEISGAVPPAKRPPVRQRYRLIELQRIADFLGLPINTQPTFFPVDATLADHTIIALMSTGADPIAYMADIFASVWSNQANIADEETLAKLLVAHGHDADAVLTLAKSAETSAIRDQNSADAIAADAVGVPAYVVDGEVFWGQDRIDLLDHMLSTGRPAIKT